MAMRKKMKCALKWMIGFFSVGCFFAFFAFVQHSTWEGVKDRTLAKDSISGVIPASGEKLRPMLLGFDNFAGNVYWLKMIQYVGGNAAKEKPSLFPFINLITDLDPHFYKPYHWGLTLLPTDGYLDESEKLIAKAEEKNLPDWQIFYNAGYFYFYYKDDYEKSIFYYEKCLQMEGCIDGAKRMLRNLQTRSGKYETAIANRFEDLTREDISEEDIELSKKKIKEAADLMFLNEAVPIFLAEGKTINEPKDLQGFAFETSKKNIVGALEQSKEFLGFAYPTRNGKMVISEEMLISPWEQTNAYVWDSEKQKIKPKLFK